MVIIVGDPTDPHVALVSQHLAEATIFDASTIGLREYGLDVNSFVIDGRRVGIDSPARGWIRRLAPSQWSHGIRTGSHDAVARAAAVSLLAAITRVPGTGWLTDLDSLLLGESKLTQMRVAATLGIRYPATIVTGTAAAARAALGTDVVIKPLGPGNYTRDDGSEVVVYAHAADLSDPQFADLGPTPFLIQERLRARVHHRVVTVQDRCWVASLEAAEFAMDWRADAEAHHSFTHDPDPDTELIDSARDLARHLGLGYSSQDWLRTTAGDLAVLDVNPGGQWAFLPESVTDDVANSIADWLRGARG